MKLSPKSLAGNKNFNYGLVIVFAAALSYFFSAPGQTLFIGFAFSRFLGQGSMTLLPSLVLPKWFVKKSNVFFYHANEEYDCQ